MPIDRALFMNPKFWQCWWSRNWHNVLICGHFCHVIAYNFQVSFATEKFRPSNAFFKILNVEMALNLDLTWTQQNDDNKYNNRVQIWWISFCVHRTEMPYVYFDLLWYGTDYSIMRSLLPKFTKLMPNFPVESQCHAERARQSRNCARMRENS